MEQKIITLKEAADKLGQDRSSLLKALKKAGVKLGKKINEDSRGQEVTVMLMSDFETFCVNKNNIKWED